MNNQEIFNIVWNGLKSQGFKQSMNKWDSCAYRGNNGLKCAAGWLLPDEEYDEAFNEKCVNHIPWFSTNFDQHAYELIEELQDAHDALDSKYPEHMMSRLKDVAIKYNLEIPE